MRGARIRPSTLVSNWIGNGLVTNFTAYESIAGTVTVGAGGQSTITFISIPQTYKHLQIRVIGRTDRAASSFDSFRMQFNSVTTSAQYRTHFLYGSGTTTASADEGNTSGIINYRMSAASSGTSIFGSSIVDILDYADTNKNKTSRCLAGSDQNGSGEIYIGGGVWMNTAAISTITIVPNIGTNFVQYSQFALYGIKG